MRKGMWAVVVIALGVVFVVVVALVAAGVFFFLRHRPSGPVVTGTQAQAPRRQAAHSLPLRPQLILEVNGATEIDAVQGTPLVLTVRASNPRARNAAATNQARQRCAEAVQAQAARGEIPAERAKAALEAAQMKESVESVRAGSNGRGWDTFLRFERRTAEGRAEPLNWPLSLVAAPASKDVTLDETSTAELNYALPPDAAARVGAGTYQIVAVFEVTAGENVPAGHWRGRAESKPVKVSLTASGAQVDPAAAITTNLQRARFFEMTKDWTNALQSAQQVLAANPQSLPAQIIVGKAKEAQGDRLAALAAYATALSLFDQQHPDSLEPPEYLIRKVASLAEPPTAP